MEIVQLEGTPEERAKKVGEAIRCALKANGGKLHRRWYQTLEDSGACTACAVGSLAMACGIKLGGGHARGKFKEGILADPHAKQWITSAEVDQLEMGFEGERLSAMMDVTKPANACEVWLPDFKNPFYKLGQELAEERVQY